MGKITITKIFEFAAAHKLPCYKGLCNNLHGHTYKIEITIEGKIQKQGPAQGMIMDFSVLKKIVNSCIIDYYDHSNLNDFFINPTAEIMIQEIVNKIEPELSYGIDIIKARLWETPTSYATWERK